MKRIGSEPATRDDVVAASTRTDQPEKTLEELLVEVRGIKPAIEAKSEEICAEIAKMYSRLSERIDTFMAESLKVERAKIRLIRRMDKREARVTRIETCPS